MFVLFKFTEQFSKLYSKKGLYALFLALLACGVLGAMSEGNAQIIQSMTRMLSGAIHVEKEAVSSTEALLDQTVISEFYMARNGRAFWMDSGGLNDRGDAMIGRIESAWTHGLNPQNYHYSEIFALLGESGMESRITLDILLSDAFVRYSRDLSGMRVRPAVNDLNPEDWKAMMSAEEAIALLKAEPRDMGKLFAKIEPQGQTYNALREKLVYLVESADRRKERLLPIEISYILRPGQGHNAIPRLREFFELPEVSNNNRHTYDDDLAARVIAFQKENGLKADGIIGPETLAVLNRSNNQKIQQIIANLERLRWDDVSERGDKYITVNIPAAMMWAVSEGKVEFEVPVVVGRPNRQTKIFKTEITGIRLNPDWTVPPTIKRLDILPKLREDPEFYSVVGMRMMGGYGSDSYEIDPTTVDWNSITSRELHSIRMVQVPGINNPLGRYRVIMPNAHNIYLHDTTMPELFEQDNRAQSSGCIRVKDPHKMAEFILRELSDWNEERIARVVSTKRKTDISIQSRIPVSILYYTAWLNSDGQVAFGNDVYGLDKKLVNALLAIDGFAIPKHNEEIVAVSDVLSSTSKN